jgi:hypothetical protein
MLLLLLLLLLLLHLSMPTERFAAALPGRC